jgi:hypothetical protein
MLPLATTDEFYGERDRRRPCGWDWLLCFINPLTTIAYHHRRAGFSLAHVFVLVVATALAGFGVVFMTTSWVFDFMSAAVKQYGVERVSEVMSRFVALSYYEQVKMTQEYFGVSMKNIVLELSRKFYNYFVLVLVVASLFVVHAAKKATEKSRQEMIDGLLIAGSSSTNITSLHPFMTSPKGRGSGVLAFLIALINPSVSYAINSDRRLVNFGMSFLSNTLLQAILFCAGFRFGIRLFVDNIVKEEVKRSLLNGANIALIVSVSLYVFIPLRMAMNNLQNAREKYRC